AALCGASGHSVKGFARLLGIDGRKLRGKRPVDYSEDVMAASAIDQMRTEATETPSNIGRPKKSGPAKKEPAT
ncbi:MAG: hypothetical protein V3R90_05750, partial [Limibaculum sp.]